jgi:hypothetical protein
MAADESSQALKEEIARLVAELDKAELYEQRLRKLISETRDQLANGHPAIALSMLNGALSEIDSETDVVVPQEHGKGVDAAES